jgi:peptide/nickel transport system permease protein
MTQFILRRLASGLVLILVIPSLAFALMFASGTNVARQILGLTATQEQVADKAAELGVDRPLLSQFVRWGGDAIQGDLGRSWFTGEPVASAVANRLPVTLTLVIGTTLVAAALAVVLGVLAATRRGWIDGLVQVLAIVGFAIPSFWLALVLVSTFAVQAQVFPATGFTPFDVSPTEWARSITLPIAALAVGAVASIAQQVRGAVIDVLAMDYVRTLRSRGMPQRVVLFRHVLRNAAGPGLSVLALQFVGLLGGAVIVERIFTLPGIGQLAVSSTVSGDIPMVMGVVIATTVVVVLVNLVIDLVTGLLNPKVRLA